MFTLFLLLFLVSAIEASDTSFSVEVPKTAYVQWLSSPNATMTAVEAEPRVVTTDAYIGVMCNSLDGYRMSFATAVEIAPVAGSIAPGTEIHILDKGVIVKMADASALPLSPKHPHVFHIRAENALVSPKVTLP
ncbi:MAG: hypothetical protein KDK78_02535 [Chlamydiia bacterium]|nr:hypothetical protein [Chlamydiia bacterium]